MNILDEIVRHKHRELQARQAALPLPRLRELLRQSSEPPRDFACHLRRPGLGVIAEIKRRSPSRGELRPALDPADLARRYERAGAAAVSVLTDEHYFGGSDADLRAARSATALPVLRKDFTIDEYQVYEARHLGADAILLIVRILDDRRLAALLELARELGLAALVETHCADEVRRAVACGAAIIGVNARNLDNFEVSLSNALRLRTLIPEGHLAVAESGIHTPADVRRVAEAGFDAILVGEALVTAADPGQKLRDLLGGRP